MSVAALVLGVLVGTNLAIFAADLVELRARRMAARLAEVVTEERTHDDLTALADAVRECPEQWRDEVGCDARDAHVCAVKGEHTMHMCPCGSLVVDPRPTYGQERLYDAADLVQVGLAMVHRGCRDARRDAASDHVCAACGRIFGRVAT